MPAEAEWCQPDADSDGVQPRRRPRHYERMVAGRCRDRAGVDRAERGGPPKTPDGGAASARHPARIDAEYSGATIPQRLQPADGRLPDPIPLVQRCLLMWTRKPPLNASSRFTR